MRTALLVLAGSGWLLVVVASVLELAAEPRWVVYDHAPDGEPLRELDERRGVRRVSIALGIAGATVGLVGTMLGLLVA